MLGTAKKHPNIFKAVRWLKAAKLTEILKATTIWELGNLAHRKLIIENILGGQIV